MATSTVTAPTLTYTPSPLVKYIALIALFAGAVALTYFMHVFPTWVGWASVGSFIPSVLYFAAHDLEGSKIPNGVPAPTTFIVVTVGTALVGAVGAWVVNDAALTLSAVLTWLVVVLGAIFHAVNEDQGANAPLTAEAWATAGLGIGIGLIGFFLANPTAGVSAWVATAFTVVPMYVHISTDGSSVSASPVTPAPTPA
jgi:hypothetical protein